eukprot:219021-Chlamydomonas_euryale.AAC.7
MGTTHVQGWCSCSAVVARRHNAMTDVARQVWLDRCGSAAAVYVPPSHPLSFLFPPVPFPPKAGALCRSTQYGQHVGDRRAQ